jgi:hypothetical protein
LLKYVAVVLFTIFATFPCLAQNSQTFRTCIEKAKTQAEMNQCTSNELARANGRHVQQPV